MWVRNGDYMAMQYAGSEAMHKVEEKKKSPSVIDSNNVNKLISMSKSKMNGSDANFTLSSLSYKAFAAVKRYYSNVTSDFERQQSIDLILGVFQTSTSATHVWDVKQRPHLKRGSIINITNSHYRCDHYNNINDFINYNNSKVPNKNKRNKILKDDLLRQSPSIDILRCTIDYCFNKITLEKVNIIHN